ncbi:cytochrome c [Nitratireductor sp. XY-223]|uniref:c-type cytochrome n=1 Tax=Nitratireductor sp. XY-223 TaxID=2561926 RepID=UPI0010AAE992|nr:cytochrome c [Nitratireductor sp. XY-223]
MRHGGLLRFAGWAVIGLFLAVSAPARADGLVQADVLYNGYYQSVLGDCSGCHTKAGGALLAGGDPIETPFGTIVPPNITPDVETGIGRWSLEDFRGAMHRGIGRGGKRLYPAMPYPYYALMPQRDVDALWTWLQTVPPVSNAVEANLLPFPFNEREAMAGWNEINFRPGPFQRDPDRSDQWNRGAYLVRGPGHCAACHSPKNVTGGDVADRYLQGALLQGWFAPEITGDAWRGLGGWSEEEIVAYLATGTSGRAVASGPMREVIEASTSKMKNDDLRAIATYLKSLAGSDGARPTPVAADNPRMVAGGAVYRDNCAACHGTDGDGARNLIPALAGSAAVQQEMTDTLARVVIEGVQGASSDKAPTAPAMPALGWRLSDAEVADVLTYIRNSWGNAAAEVEARSVEDVRAKLK